MNQKITTQNALMKFGEKKWANTDIKYNEQKNTSSKKTHKGRKTKTCSCKNGKLTTRTDRKYNLTD